MPHIEYSDKASCAVTLDVHALRKEQKTHMGAPQGRVLSFPPLSVPPQWATASAPDPAAVQRLRDQAADLYDRLSDIDTTLVTVSGPTREMLEAIPTAQIRESLAEIVATLRAMSYPADLTAWINDTRVLAARTATRFDECLGHLQRLYRLRSTSTAAYRDTLGMLRQAVNTMLEDLDRLLELLDEYLASTEDVAVTDAGAEAGSDAAEETLIAPAIIWGRGRQAGLREALDLIQETFLSYADTGGPEAFPSLERMAERLVSTLDQRIRAAAPASSKALSVGAD